MSDNNTPQGNPDSAGDGEGEKTLTFTQAEIDALVGERVKRTKTQLTNKFADYDAIKTELETLKTAGMSELEKAKHEADAAAKRAEEAEKRADELKAAKELSDLAGSKGIPVDALVGTAEERANAIAALIAGATKPRTPEPDPTQGRTSEVLPLNGDGLENSLRAKLGIPN